MYAIYSNYENWQKKKTLIEMPWFKINTTSNKIINNNNKSDFLHLHLTLKGIIQQ